MTASPVPAARRGVLVTGGSSGIGLAIALRLGRSGAPVFILARNANAARERVEAAFAEDRLAPPVLLDGNVSDRQRLAEIAQDLARQSVDIGTVVASAGIAVRALALDVDDDDVRSMMDTNLYGVFLTFSTFAPLVLAGPDGRFIALSSMSAVHGQRLRAVYAATKAGVSGLVRGLATEWSPMGATVNAIAPGILRTPLTAAYLDSHPERMDAAMAHSLVGRLGTVEDVAHAAEFLASEGASFMTGQTLILDGGMTAGSVWW